MPAFRVRHLNVKLIRKFSNLPEFTEKPEYPGILDLSRRAVKRRESEVWHDKIKRLETVEEKLIEVNMPKYYGWPCIGLYESYVPYNSLQFAQYITRTFILDQSELPKFYQATGITDVCIPILEHIKNSVKDAIVLEYAVQRSPVEIKESEEDLNDVGEAVMHQLNRVITSSLAADFPHLKSCEVDYFPRVESFWIVGGIDPPQRIEKVREKTCKEDLGLPVDVKLQYLGRPVAQLRHKFPLPPLTDESETQNTVALVPLHKYDPRVLGVDKLRRHVTNIPGFWPGNESEFPLMSFHSSKHLKNRLASFDDTNDAPFVQAILASFAWLQSLACYKGFSTFQDVTYPLVTQTILSDGQYWSFYVYQMNTMLLHSEHAMENPKCNFCWGTSKLKLFDKVEDGKVVGFNEDVLRILLCFYLNVPQSRTEIELKPYLGAENKYLANIIDLKRRDWLEKRFKYMYSNRPRHFLPYELYHWEKIYKVDHKTRPMEPRRRPFELNRNPLETRRYDDHVRQYIPKAKRASKKSGKFEDAYYP